MTFCTECGAKLAQPVKYCPECGRPQADLSTPTPASRTATPTTPQKGQVRGTARVFVRGLLILLAGLVGLAACFVYLRVRPFPLEGLKCEEGKLHYGEQGEVQGFSVRVTNETDTGATDIRIRLDIFDKNKGPIDGGVFWLRGTLPARGTRQLYERYLGLGSLPPRGDWDFSYRVESATKAPPWSLD